MFILWDEDSPQKTLVTCVSIVLIFVLLWYIFKQDYLSSCDRKIMNMHYQQHITGKNGPPQPLISRPIDIAQSTNPWVERMTDACGTMLEKHKKTLNPEKEVMTDHELGDNLRDSIQQLDDPLTLDGLLQRSAETHTGALLRSIAENKNGPQMEGMYDPVEERERAAMKHQLVKKQEIYGAQNYEFSEADKLSELNI